MFFVAALLVRIPATRFYPTTTTVYNVEAMNLSGLPWWGWILGALGSVALGLIFQRVSDRKDFGNAAKFLVILFWLAALAMAVVGVVLFINGELFG